MDKRKFYLKSCEMIYLTRCVINNQLPDKNRIDVSELNLLYEVCKEHSLTACVAYALESAGISDNNFSQAKEKAVRKNVLLDNERNVIFGRFEDEHIWYMPLSGAILKDLYPEIGMRQMTENDILFDSSQQKKMLGIMLERGFKAEKSSPDADEFSKEPVYYFEMHKALFNKQVHDYQIYKYFSDIKKILVKDEDNSYGYHFTNEDFYIYVTANEHRHFSKGGTGVRSLLDIYVFINRYGKILNWEYMDSVFEKLGLSEFEEKSRNLAMKLFSGQKLSDEDRKNLVYYIFSGSYSNQEYLFENKMKALNARTKTGYVLKRIFPSMAYYEKRYPVAYKYKILLPFAWLYRMVRGIFTKKDLWSKELHFIARKK